MLIDLEGIYSAFQTVLIPLGVDKTQISALLVRFFLLEQHLLSRLKEELLILPKTLMFVCLSCLA